MEKEKKELSQEKVKAFNKVVFILDIVSIAFFVLFVALGLPSLMLGQDFGNGLPLIIAFIAAIAAILCILVVGILSLKLNSYGKIKGKVVGIILLALLGATLFSAFFLLLGYLINEQPFHDISGYIGFYATPTFGILACIANIVFFVFFMLERKKQKLPPNKPQEVATSTEVK